MKAIIKFLVFSLFLLVFVACEKDDDNDFYVGEGNILVSTMLPNPDGMSGSAYMQMVGDLSAQSMNNKKAQPIPFSCPPMVCDNNVFTLPGWTGETDLMTKYSWADGTLTERQTITLPEQSGATNVVTKGDFAYVSCALSGKILVLNHQDMTIVKEIDLSSYGVGDQNPDPSSMLIRDNLLYVPLSQMVGGYFPAKDRAYTDVLIINTENNQVVKMITHSASGISTPTRPVDPHSIFMDENKDIYIAALGAFGALPGHKSGFLRIKAGETEFDETYSFIFNDIVIEGEPNKMDYLHAIRYSGNNKVYGTANIPAYYSNPPNFIEDRTVIAVEVDLAAKTIKKLDFPYSTNFGVGVGIYNNTIVFGLATKSSNGYYTYNPSTGEASTSAVISTEGYPYSFNSFK